MTRLMYLRHLSEPQRTQAINNMNAEQAGRDQDGDTRQPLGEVECEDMLEAIYGAFYHGASPEQKGDPTSFYWRNVTQPYNIHNVHDQA